MKIDIHVHSSERSSCGRSSEEEIIRSAIVHGLDAIVFTDHNEFIPDDRLIELNEKYRPFKIFKGIEVSVPKEHVLVIGLDDTSLESEDWTYEDLHKFVRDNSAYMAIAHPFRYRDYINADLNIYPPDAIETHSANTTKDTRPSIYEMIQKHDLKEICTSDAHHVDRVGIFYNELNYPARDERELTEILKAGEYTCKAMQDRVDKINEDIEAIEERINVLHGQGKSVNEIREIIGIHKSRIESILEGVSYKI
ncbi:MAG: hypothetical protein GX974_07650 [Clostridiales bacterium]|nr:hypothetical protein [Clostridiales bacterium]